jgi:glucose dehydrogenase
MPQAVPVAFGFGIVAALLLFWRLPPRQAAIAVLLGGWLLLPTARYPMTSAGSGSRSG